MHNKSKTDRVLLTINKILLVVIVLIILIPLIYILIGSFLDPNVMLRKGLSFNPVDWTLEGYKRVFQDGSIVKGFINSIIYAGGFTFFTILFTVLVAYPLSIKGFRGGKVIMIFFLITMFFNGGLIPTYMLIKNLGMLDTPWAIILPGSIGVWNIILVRTFFKGLPNELKQAAEIDGATDLQIFLKIVLPLSKPVIFVIALYAFVGQWNSYFDALIYLDDRDLYPLQLILRSILIENEVQPGMVNDKEAAAELSKLAEKIKYASIVISSLPLLVMYPFFQKYFEKGVMVGSLK